VMRWGMPGSQGSRPPVATSLMSWIRESERDYGPAVAVFHPVGRGDTESAVIPASDHKVVDAGAVAIG
jgi:hypothetical protein